MTGPGGSNGNGRTALVTGGRRGIGKAIALSLAADGFDIAICDIGERGLTDLVAEVHALGRRAFATQADIADANAVSALVQQVEIALGRIDVLINNAGLGATGTVLELTLEDWDRIMNVNLRGTFLCSKAVLPGMIARGWGRIVCLSSAAAQGRGAANYAASKAAVSAFTKVLATEVGQHAITVNAVAPGVTTTEWVKRHRTPELLEHALHATPLGRLGRPEDVADTVSFLCSDRGGWITGQTIQTSGGQIMLG